MFAKKICNEDKKAIISMKHLYPVWRIFEWLTMESKQYVLIYLKAFFVLFNKNKDCLNKIQSDLLNKTSL